MPELPEVETVKNELTPAVTGRQITGVTVLWNRMVRIPSAEQFRTGLKGRKIEGLRRRGKFLIFNLNNGRDLILHLGMTGSLLVKPAAEKPDKFARAIFELDNRTVIQFRDARKFGKMWLVDDAAAVVKKLGPEPLERDFTVDKLARILGNRKAPIKSLLLNQALIAGLGNMYADEALFRAGIHPLKSGESLTSKQLKRLHLAIKQVLQRGIRNNGASVQSYFRPDGSKGTAHLEFQVAHRKGEPCPKCGRPIVRIVVGGRGTFFCPHDQPE
jgi:formamidopyrimidine-DNA glycosylase